LSTRYLHEMPPVSEVKELYPDMSKATAEGNKAIDR